MKGYTNSPVTTGEQEWNDYYLANTRTKTESNYHITG